MIVQSIAGACWDQNYTFSKLSKTSFPCSCHLGSDPHLLQFQAPLLLPPSLEVLHLLIPLYLEVLHLQLFLLLRIQVTLPLPSSPPTSPFSGFWSRLLEWRCRHDNLGEHVPQSVCFRGHDRLSKVNLFDMWQQKMFCRECHKKT